MNRSLHARIAGLTALVAAFTLPFLVGCDSGNGLDTHTVRGTVTFDGKPLETGRITFKGTGAHSRSFSGDIVNGAYELESEAGPMTVEVIASRIIPGKFDTSNGTKEPVGEMYIPKKYNSESQLKAEVTAGGDNTFPFDLTAK